MHLMTSWSLSAVFVLFSTSWRPDSRSDGSRIGLGPNKWMAKMSNVAAKKTPGGIVWWREEDISTLLHPLPVESMWGLKKRAETLKTEFQAETIGDVAQIQIGRLKARFGVWGEGFSRWGHG